MAELAAERVPVLLLGETGTGKTLVAHELQPQAVGTAERGRFFTMNCASLGETQLADVVCERLPGLRYMSPESAQDTLFIDEIGELSPWGQAVLLRALSAYEPSTAPRIVAATHRDLEAMVRSGRFSGELLMRLRGATLCLPPLRERRDEIAALALHFLRVALGVNQLPFVSLDPLVLVCLEMHSWPGNVRELQNAMVSSLARSLDGMLTVDTLPDEIRGDYSNSADET